MINRLTLLLLVYAIFALQSCADDGGGTTNLPTNNEVLASFFGSNIDLDNLPNYANQAVPNYITKDNTGGNIITDNGAALGRILFYDKALSINNEISCSSCHVQANGFSDMDVQSQGVDGVTERHSMRLINARFSDEDRFFWDERANSLEDQSTQPIQDHIEMGFSGENGDPSFTDLIIKMNGLDYYPIMFTQAFGNSTISEPRMQQALAQFIRSIQSFDSRFDQGRAQVNNNNNNFPNYTAAENAGKNLFLAPPQFNNGVRIGGGAGCQGCHQAPEFSINDISRNNGVIVTADGTSTDLTNTKAPSLRDVVDANGNVNGPLMHSGSFTSLLQVINHYNSLTLNPNLDNVLRPGGNAQQLMLTDAEKANLVAFLETLSGSNVYIDEKWSDPFL